MADFFRPRQYALWLLFTGLLFGGANALMDGGFSASAWANETIGLWLIGAVMGVVGYALVWAHERDKEPGPPGPG